MNEVRPSPDALLKAAQREGRGRLKIILGAAPGVGKTYEMLREGADAVRQGTDVVVGIVETHGRAETQALLDPFEVLPRQAVTHAGHSLGELDIDAMLARAPKLALVDELAHTNAPGSRHPKRWQDIEELRDAGIDVLTTLNVQHVESLNDVVASFTHVRVRETVPDALLDDADIEVVDLPPDELIARLKAGKVYVPGEATRALDNFFNKANLSALRELALRRAALAVDRALLDHVETTGVSGTWKGGERLVVAVGDQPGADELVRTAKRLADGLRASWTALAIETPRSATLPAAAQARIAAALDLAAGLGATLATIPARSVEEGLRRHMADTRATALVIGKQRRSWWFELQHRSVVDKLVRTLDGIAVHVVPVTAAPENGETIRRPLRIAPMMAAALMVAAMTVLAKILQPWIGTNSVDLLYLIPVIGAAVGFGMRPALFASVGAALCYNFFFLPPTYNFTVSDPQNAVTLFVLVVVAVAASRMTGRLRREANVGVRTASENAALAAFGQRLAAVSDEDATAAVVCEEIAALLDVDTVLIISRSGRHTPIAGQPTIPLLNPIDMAAIDWTFERNEATGRKTGTLNAAEWQFQPLSTAMGVLAVLGLSRDQGDPVPPERRVLFATLLGQAALAHERISLEAEAREVNALRQRDNLRTTLIASMGHDLKTPLTSVVAAAGALAARHGASEEASVLRTEARRLSRVFDDLVEMTRIDSGALKVRAEAIDLTDAATSATNELKNELGEHAVAIDVPASLPLVEADPRMLQHILVNLLANAAKFAPPASGIIVGARDLAGGVCMSVSDEGPGLPAGRETAIFERFASGEGDDRSGGTGLGLAIVKGFADAMGIRVSASNRPEGGARLDLIWPPAKIARDA